MLRCMVKKLITAQDVREARNTAEPRIPQKAVAYRLGVNPTSYLDFELYDAKLPRGLTAEDAMHVVEQILEERNGR